MKNVQIYSMPWQEHVISLCNNYALVATSMYWSSAIIWQYCLWCKLCVQQIILYVKFLLVRSLIPCVGLLVARWGWSMLSSCVATRMRTGTSLLTTLPTHTSTTPSSSITLYSSCSNPTCKAEGKHTHKTIDCNSDSWNRYKEEWGTVTFTSSLVCVLFGMPSWHLFSFLYTNHIIWFWVDYCELAVRSTSLCGISVL